MPRRTNATILHTDLMRWEPLAVPGADGYAWIKTLSKDAETGARTALIKYDAGFTAPAAVARWPLDAYVLDGEMRSGDRTYEKHTFHYRPAGARIGPIRSEHGVMRLVFTADSAEPGGSSPDEVFVQSAQRDLPWDAPPPGRDTGGQPDAYYPDRMLSSDPLMEDARLRRTKTLRTDTPQQIRLWVYSAKRAGLRNMIGEVHAHAYPEELFMLEGANYEYLDELDAHLWWGPGTYLCRPAGECLHGDTLKLADDSWSIVRSGATDDPATAARWKTQEKATTRRLAPVVFRD